MTEAATHTSREIALRSLQLICDGDTGPAVDELIAPDCIDHSRPGRGPDGFRDVVRALTATFAEVSITANDIVASDDRVVARARFSGLHVGPFQGVAPSNRTIRFDQIHIWRVKNGRVAEHWAFMDTLGALRQMGVELRYPS